jgi:hypothetical protein
MEVAYNRKMEVQWNFISRSERKTEFWYIPIYTVTEFQQKTA